MSQTQVDQLAERIHDVYPVTVGVPGGGRRPLDWQHVDRAHPERAAIYRQAAKSVLDAEADCAGTDEPNPS